MNLEGLVLLDCAAFIIGMLLLALAAAELAAIVRSWRSDDDSQ